MSRVKHIGLLARVMVLGLVMSLLASTLVAAQAPPTATEPVGALNLTTSPLPLYMTAKPGQTVTSEIRVKNNSTRPETLRIELLKFGASGEDGNPEIKEREQRDTYFDWVTFSDSTFTAEPNVWKNVKITIKTPASAAYGYYYAVLFSRVSQQKPSGGSTGVQGGVATLVLFDVQAPGTKKQAEILEVTASKKVYEFLPAEINVKIRNTGNIHLAPFGSVFIKRGSSQVDMVDFNTPNGNILPGTNRVFKVEWSKGFPFYEKKIEGNTVTSKLKWDFSKVQDLRIGRYTAVVTAGYDNGKEDVPIEGTVSFWVIPWRILGGLLLILLFVGFGIFMMLRSAWKKLRPRSSKGPRGGRRHDAEPLPSFGPPKRPAAPESHPGPAPPTAPELPGRAPAPQPPHKPRPPRKVQF